MIVPAGKVLWVFGGQGLAMRLQPQMSVVLRLGDPEQLVTACRVSVLSARARYCVSVYCSMHAFLNVINTPCASTYSVSHYVARERAISWLSLKRDLSNKNIQVVISLREIGSRSQLCGSV